MSSGARAMRNSSTSELWCAVEAVLSHWRAHLGQLVALVGGLTAATALFVGVQSLNSEARKSYAAAEQGLTSQDSAVIKGTEGRLIPPQDYGTLRRMGVPVTPVIEGQLTVGEIDYRLVGYDIFTQGPLASRLAFLRDASVEATSQRLEGQLLGGGGVVFVDPTTKAKLLPSWGQPAGQGEDESEKKLALWPSLEAIEGVPPGYIYADIAVADRLLKRGGAIDKLLITKSDAEIPDLSGRLSIGVRLIPPAEQLDLEQLTESFHLNLTAFSFLSFLVGLFIVYAALSLAYQDRLPLFRTLLTLGISRTVLVKALLTELVVLSLLGGLLGMAVGYGLSVMLMPGVSNTINNHYGASHDGGVSLSLHWIAIAMGASFSGAALAGLQLLYRLMTLPVLALKDGRAWQARASRSGFRLGLYSGLLFLFSMAVHHQLNSLLTAFIFMATFLVFAAMILPVLLTGLFRYIAGFKWSAKLQWFWAETAADAPRISLALMALLLALSSHFGVKTMVSGYRATFTDFLEERLAAHVYFRAATPEQGDDIVKALKASGQIDRYLSIWTATRSYRGTPLMITSFDDDPLYKDTWTLLSVMPDGWRLAAEGDALLINEQMSLAEKIAAGDTITLETDRGAKSYLVAGVFADYGNPIYQVRLITKALIQMYDLDQRTNYGLMVQGDVDSLITAMKTQYGLDDTQVINQGALKALALSVFNQTFKISAALGFLTLAIASGALLSSLLSLAEQRLTLLAPLWGMGMPRRALARFELTRVLALSLTTAVIAMPIGMGVAYILIDHINVAAFGWRLPYYLDATAFTDLLLLAFLTAVIAMVLPIRRLLKIQPAALAKVFAHEG